jgi:hypothetical protein
MELGTEFVDEVIAGELFSWLWGEYDAEGIAFAREEGTGK